jgi:acylphosphatase
MGDDRVRRHLRIRGDVQGVNYREATRRRATEAGVAGWVRNCRDGSVEAVLEGRPEAVQQVVEFLREGPTAATVGAFDEREEPAQGLSGFHVH